MHNFIPGCMLLGNVCPSGHSFTYRCMISIYRISSIRRLGINQQIVYCVPGVNLNVEFPRSLERITSTPPGVGSEICRESNRGKTVCASLIKVKHLIFSLKLVQYYPRMHASVKTGVCCSNATLLLSQLKTGRCFTDFYLPYFCFDCRRLVHTVTSACQFDQP